MATLDTLLEEKTAATYQAEMLADLADPAVVGGTGLPTTSWQPGSTPRTLIAAQSQVAADFNASQRAIARGGFLDYAEGDWLTLLAVQLYIVTRAAPVATLGIATLTDTGGGPHTISASQLIAKDASGREFRNVTGGTLTLSGSLALRWQAVATGADYNIGSSTLTTLVTALAGVTINNPATWLTLPGTASSKAQGTVRITDGALTGPHVVGAGTVTVTDGSHAFTNVNTFTITTAGGYADVLFEASANGLAYNVANSTLTTVSVTPVAGLTSTNPGSTWITTSGAEEQTDADLREECRDKWSTLGVGWTSSAIEYLAQQAATSTPVTRVLVETNPGSVAGLVGVVIGSVVGPMSSADVAVVQAHFDDDRITLTSALAVSSCTSVTIALTATIRVPAAYSATIQAGVALRLSLLAQGTPIGGDPNKGNTLTWEDIIAAIVGAAYDSSGRQTSAAVPYDVDISAVTVGGSPATVGADIALTAYQVPTFSNTFTYVGV
jgi:hypothetical protein